MSRLYEEHLENLEESERQEVVRYLLTNGQLDEPAAGVARQYVERGYDSLSAPQRHVLETYVFSHFVEHCSMCSQSVPMSEQINAMDSGLCGYCEHKMNKDD